MKKLSNEEYRNKLSIKNPWVEPISEYINAKTPLLCRCKICGREWLANPGRIMSGTKCRPCAIKMNSDKQKKSHQAFIAELALKNPNIEVLGEYSNYATKVNVRCKICQHEWAATPNNLLSGKGCPVCGIKKNADAKRNSQHVFLTNLAAKNSSVEAIGEYYSVAEKMTFRCKTCGYIWEAKPNHILAGHGCPVCGGSKKKQHNQFISEYKTVNPYIQILGHYTNAHAKLLCRCLLCENEWYASPDKLLQGTGCPQCDKRNKTSFPEQAIFYYIKAVFSDAINRYHDEKEISEIDVFIPSLRIGIEYDGAYYHHNIQRDIQKYEACQMAGITLYRIIEEEIQSEGVTADRIILRKKPLRYESLNECISELLNLFEIQNNVDTFRDSAIIRGQYYNYLREVSVQTNYPSIASEWLYSKNGRITPEMVSYGSSDKYWWKCSKCNHEWLTTVADRTIGGKGCPICRRNSTTKKLTKTHQEFVEELNIVNPNIQPLEEYRRTHDNILFHCNRCGNEWYAAPANVLRGRDCPICSRKRGTERMKETKKKGNRK